MPTSEHSKGRRILRKSGLLEPRPASRIRPFRRKLPINKETDERSMFNSGMDL
jgi:hypothetical protein